MSSGSEGIRQREARRTRRIEQLDTPFPVVHAPIPTPPPQPQPQPQPQPILQLQPQPQPQQSVIECEEQNRVFMQLARRTVALMNKNKEIQTKIIALKKETSEFFNSVMRKPESRQRCLEFLKRNGNVIFQSEPNKVPLRVLQEMVSIKAT